MSQIATSKKSSAYLNKKEAALVAASSLDHHTIKTLRGKNIITAPFLTNNQQCIYNEKTVNFLKLKFT
jgi:hypothetical protein